MSDEWGPWIEHDGKGCPVVGLFCHVLGEGARGEKHDVQLIVKGHPCWDWSNFGKSGTDRGRSVVWAKVTRYRIRKPRGMTILESLLENLPEEVPA